MDKIIEILDSIEQSAESEYPKITYRLPDKNGKVHRGSIPYIVKLLKGLIDERTNNIT